MVQLPSRRAAPAARAASANVEQDASQQFYLVRLPFCLINSCSFCCVDLALRRGFSTPGGHAAAQTLHPSPHSPMSWCKAPWRGPTQTTSKSCPAPATQPSPPIPTPPEHGSLPPNPADPARQVRWSSAGSSIASVQTKAPPTAVMLHGIMGSKRNLQSFAKRLADAFPAWQFLLVQPGVTAAHAAPAPPAAMPTPAPPSRTRPQVDLRCHGASAAQLAPGAHTVEAAGRDVLNLLAALKLYPRVLVGAPPPRRPRPPAGSCRLFPIFPKPAAFSPPPAAGHSFGGKVAMSMLHQFGRRLPLRAQARRGRGTGRQPRAQRAARAASQSCRTRLTASAGAPLPPPPPTPGVGSGHGSRRRVRRGGRPPTRRHRLCAHAAAQPADAQGASGRAHRAGVHPRGGAVDDHQPGGEPGGRRPRLGV